MKKSYDCIGDFRISGKFTIPSGIITTTPPVMLKFAKECEELGIITSKSIGPESRKGNASPIIFQESESIILNAVGLANPGIESYVAEMKEIREVWPEHKFLLTSVFGKDKNEFVYVAKQAAYVSDGIELNFGCPHSGGLAQIGRSPELVEEITAAVVDAIDKPVLPKLTPSAYDIAAVAKAAEKAGAFGIVAINTVGPGYSQYLSNKVGGLSGATIKTIGLRCVRDIANTVDLPIIGMGGIHTLEDIIEYENVGADFLGIGSALIGMSTKTILDYFKFKQYSRDQEKKIYARPVNAKVIGIEELYEGMKIIRVQHPNIKYPRIEPKSGHFTSRSPELEPGQFMMLQPKGGEAKPFTIADDNPLTFVVRNVGETTSKINKIKEGDTISISGPYGEPLSLGYFQKTVFVGGGTGTAILNFIAKDTQERPNTTYAFIGAKTKKELIFEQSLKEKVNNVFVSTDDGSYGRKGLVTESLEKWLLKNRPEDIQFVNCGPELMIKKAVELEQKYVKWINAAFPKIYCAVERYTKCGVGLCGSCEIDGLRACIDGPVFSISRIKNAIGVYKRGADGSKILY